LKFLKGKPTKAIKIIAYVKLSKTYVLVTKKIEKKENKIKIATHMNL
jgi:hypothetical protein